MKKINKQNTRGKEGNVSWKETLLQQEANMQKQSIVIEPHETIKEFRLYLYERENAKATIDKYLTDVNTFYKFLNFDKKVYL